MYKQFFLEMKYSDYVGEFLLTMNTKCTCITSFRLSDHSKWIKAPNKEIQYIYCENEFVLTNTDRRKKVLLTNYLCISITYYDNNMIKHYYIYYGVKTNYKRRMPLYVIIIIMNFIIFNKMYRWTFALNI